MELEQFLVDVVEATGQGIFVTNNVTIRSHWNFGQSFFFVGTLLTTIGDNNLYIKHAIITLIAITENCSEQLYLVLGSSYKPLNVQP